MKHGIDSFIISSAMSIYGGHCLRRYKRIAKKADSWSEKLLLGILKRNKNTELGRRLGFGGIHSVREYQERVPYSTYEDYAGFVERMAKTGEQNLMTSDRVSFFATTSGFSPVRRQYDGIP